MENNARCPKCNGEFYVDFNGAASECPHCGATTETIKVRKYYSAFHDKAGVRRDVHGQDYFKFDEYLRIGAHYLESDEFEKAKDSYSAAVKMNPGDYRAYMGIVAAETKNYTDLKNQTHKAFLQRALAVANEEQKKHIADIYRIYNAKAEMTDEEYSEYLSEKQKDFKSRIKKAIIGLARVNDTTQKRAKVCFVFTWVMAAVGVIMLVLGIIFSMLPFMLLGLLLGGGSYATTIAWTKQRYNDRMYNFLVELFNALKDFGYGYAQTEKMLELMSALLLSIKNGDPHTTTDGIVQELVEYVEGTKSKQAIAFLKRQKLTTKLMAE
ncbi:MAG: DUF1218 domain-containing protein [Clostridia bacterium]|nr:DUF1218 domain-containing protein [Clostridia bacterium]